MANSSSFSLLITAPFSSQKVHTTGMDIKQFYTARAALTLGKDMTFRDYAQGAYRMRGIGQGQTLTLLIIPEVAKLIENEVACGAGVPVTSRPLSSDLPRVLNDVTAWLLINQMLLERTQYNMLCNQNVGNVWRKNGFRRLIANHSKIGTNEVDEVLAQSLQVSVYF